MSVSVYCEWLSAFGADRAARLYRDGVIDRVYAYGWPMNPAATSNGREWEKFRRLGVPMWSWVVCSADQEATLRGIRVLNERWNPKGVLLNIEKPLEGANLRPLIAGVKALGKPIVASLAGTSAAHVPYDYRTLDRADVAVEWQAYLDSGEGPHPREAVRELYTPSFVVDGWEYRGHETMTDRRGYAWGRVEILAAELVVVTARWRSYRTATTYVIEDVRRREWGATVADRGLTFAHPAGRMDGGKLLGRARWKNIRVALDVTRGAQDARSLDEWRALAASVKLPGLSKRPVSVYLAEVARDDVLRAIAEGAA